MQLNTTPTTQHLRIIRKLSGSRPLKLVALSNFVTAFLIHISARGCVQASLLLHSFTSHCGATLTFVRRSLQCFMYASTLPRAMYSASLRESHTLAPSEFYPCLVPHSQNVQV